MACFWRLRAGIKGVYYHAQWLKQVFLQRTSVPSIHVGGSQLPITLALLTSLSIMLTIYIMPPQKKNIIKSKIFKECLCECVCISVCLHRYMLGVCTSHHMPQWPQALPNLLMGPVSHIQEHNYKACSHIFLPLRLLFSPLPP